MAFPDSDLPLQFEAAFGADPEASPGTWVFTSLTSRHLDSVVNLKDGRRADGTTAEPSAVGAMFDNHDGALTPLRAMSPYWPNIKLDTPFRCALRRADDTFTRTVSNGWGTSDSGHAWTTAGGSAADYSTSGAQGSVAVGAVDSDRLTLVDLDGRHQDVRITATTNSTPSGGAIETGVVARYTDASNYYVAGVSVSTGGVITAVIFKRVAGARSSVASVVTALSTATSKKVRFRVTENRLQLKVWLTSAPEPDTWTIDVFDDSLTTGGFAGSYSRRSTGNSTPTTFTYDNFDTTHVLLEGFTDSWKPDFIPDTDGGTSVVRVTASGPLRRLGQGSKPLQSAAFRAISGVTIGDIVPIEYWPMEDADSATSFESAVGGQAMVRGGYTFSGTPTGSVSFAAESTLLGSLPLPIFGPACSMRAPIRPYTDTGQWVFQVMLRLPAELDEQSFGLLDLRSTNTNLPYVFISANSQTATAWRFRTQIYDAALVQTDSFEFYVNDADVLDKWLSIAVCSKLDGSGANDTISLSVYDVEGNTLGTTGAQVVDANFHGAINFAEVVSPTGQYPPTVYSIGGGAWGHAAIFTDPAFTVGVHDVFHAIAAGGHVNEGDRDRLARLCEEEQIPFSALPGFTQTPMGPQLIDTFMANALDCETTGQGVLGEGDFGLTYVPLAARYRRPVGITVDLPTYRTTAGTSRQVLSPVFDDQRFRNQWVVTRPDGAGVVVSDFSRVKLHYEDSAQPNLQTYYELVNYAVWRRTLSSAESMRWPNTPVDLAANPEMIGEWLGVTPGLTRIVRTGLPSRGPDGDIDELLDGVEHTIRRRAWTISYAASPALIYNQVGVYGSDAADSRYDSDASTLTAGYDADDTSFSVTTTGNNLWITGSGAPNFPFDIAVAGIRITVTAISGATSPQTFTVTRSVDGYDKALASGEKVSLWSPARYGL